MLRILRRIVALILFSVLTLFFLDFSKNLIPYLEPLVRIQFLPALLAHSFILLGILLVLTWLFGRFYCSFLCPMGILQDILARLGKTGSIFRKKDSDKRKKSCYEYHPAHNKFRWAFLIILILGFVTGLSILPALLDPYSAYGRIVTHLFRPLYLYGNNLLAQSGVKVNEHSLYAVEIVFRSGVFLVAVGTLLIVGFLAVRFGRLYCNTVCPVGTFLGILSRFSLFKVRLNAEKCKSCGMCARICKSSCIDIQNKIIDTSRCVDCFNCLGQCRFDALSYRWGSPAKTPVSDVPASGSSAMPPADSSRRTFLSLLTALGTAICHHKVFALQADAPSDSSESGSSASKTVSSLEVPRGKDHRDSAISPPGSRSWKHLARHCTACHLCITKCPSNVLKPAFLEYGIGGMLQPTMSFEHGFCNYDCTVCGEICPNGALTPFTQEEKHTTQIGEVHLELELCITYHDGTSCGACAEHCPTGAVHMIPHKGALTIPELTPEWCVGCGACEYICPVRPIRAIHVEGHRVHQEAQIAPQKPQEEVKLDDFGF